MFDKNHLLSALGTGSRNRDHAVFAETADGHTVRYGALFAQSRRIAAALTAHGLVPGDRVAVQVEKSVTAIALYVGTVMAGGVFLPLNTAYTDAEVDYFLKDAEPSVFVGDPRRTNSQGPLARAAGARAVFDLDEAGEGSMASAAADAAEGFRPIPRSADDLAAILYTSGTTGRSKGAMLTHDNMASNARALVEVWRFTHQDRLIHALPIFHTHGLFVATNVAMVAGCQLLFFSRFDPDRILAAMPRATAMMGVPTFYTRLLGHPGLADAARGLRVFISGSAPLLEETHRDWAAVTGHAILERYGMTETNMITSNPYDGERRPGTVGFPLPGVSVRIARVEDGAPMPKGEVGVIEVKGPNVFKGYWRMPEKTAEEFRADGWFITGDLGLIDARGYVSIVGRAKDMIITGGYNVYPKEVEAVIDAVPGVAESAVIGLAHPDFGEGVAAVVVPKPGVAVTETAILEAVMNGLAKYKHPKRIFFQESLPRNTMGKVQKTALRAVYAGTFTGR